MALGLFLIDDLLSNFLIIWAFFVALLLVNVLREPKFLSILVKQKRNFYVVWQTLKLYKKYLFRGDEDFLVSLLEDMNRLQPTPYIIDNAFVPLAYIDKPVDVQIVLNSSNSLDKAYVYKAASKYLDRSMFASPVPLWKSHRRLISHSFSSGFQELFLQIFNRKSRQFVTKLQKSVDAEEVIDMWDPTMELSFDTMLETMMGIGESENIFSESEKFYFKINSENFTATQAYKIPRIWFHSNFIFTLTAKIKGWIDGDRDLLKTATKIVRYKERSTSKKESSRNKISGGVFIAKLLEARNSGDPEFTDVDVTQETLFMMMAATETNSTNICNTLLMLAIFPDIQDKVYREIVKVIGGEDDNIKMEDVESLHLLDRCLKETLRLYPPFPMIARNATGNIRLNDGQLIEKGTTIIVPSYNIHRKEGIYENPNVWDPDHFLPERVEKRHPYSFLPFSAGPRGCLGVRYAMLSMKVTMATLLRKYQVTTNTKMEDIKFKFDVFLRNKNGWNVRLHHRHPRKLEI